AGFMPDWIGRGTGLLACRSEMRIGMRVVIDATPLLVRSAGVKNYLYYWLTHLRRAAGDRAIRTFPAMSRLGGLRHDTSIAGRFETVRGLATLALANYTPLPVIDLATRGAD